MPAFIIRKKPIPTYTDLNWIQGGGINGPYIDTEIIPSSLSSFYLKMQINIGINAYIMGFVDFSNLSNNWNIVLTGNMIDVNISDSNSHTIGEQTSNIIELNFNNNNDYYLNSAKNSIYTKNNNFKNTNESPWYLFAYSYNNNIISKIEYKIYSCIIYEDNEKVREFKPVKRDKDNIVGMLDIINNEFYSSANSANFIGG